jgi:hypothetical protein
LGSGCWKTAYAIRNLIWQKWSDALNDASIKVDKTENAQSFLAGAAIL